MTVKFLRPTRLAFAISAGLPAVLGFAAEDVQPANPAEILELPTIEVIGTTPLPGIGTPIKDVPGNVQVHTGKDIDKQKPTDLSEYLDQNPTSVTVNAAQGNPFQVDVNFRGFTASPLLGTPQGVSVFQDGVRVNESFGDVVNWDFIPQSAISSIQIIPGSNPVFGLNTLGGALSVYTKSGSQYPGASIEALYGSFNRKQVTAELGGKGGANFDYFLTANWFDEDGWGDHNPSEVKQFFGKVGWQNEKTDFDLSLTAADNRLEGMQSLPVTYIRENRAQAYTFPDINNNKLTFLNAKFSHFFTDDVLLAADTYYRRYKNTNLSSNNNNDFGSIDPVTGIADGVEAFNDLSTIDQDGYGASVQLTLNNKFGARKNQVTFGASADLGKADFTQESQEADFTPDRAAVAIGDFELETKVQTENKYYGLYFTDTLNLTEQWTLTLSGRYNIAKVSIRNKNDGAPEDDRLNGDHTFKRFNPAVGVNFTPVEKVTAYATYNEGMRAPTPMELTCADPNAPCKLPNSFLADPPLEKVVSKTVEIGARGKFGEASTWSASAFRTDLFDDIQFISTSATGANTGFFRNVGKTRRQGAELSAGTKLGKFSLLARYSYLDATFQSNFTVFSPFNSSAANGDIQVRPGNKIPGLPQHTLKLRGEFEPNESFSVGANFIYASDIYARGDENNQDSRGKIADYSIINLDASYKPVKKLELFVRVNNLLDKTYSNFGVLGENLFPQSAGKQFVGPGNGEVEQFQSLGAPRGIWAGVRYTF